MLQTENFHSHTRRCGHAEGTEREYVEKAIEYGLTKLGFSDHAPYVFEGDYYSTFRMKPEDIAGYFEVIAALREEFSDRIEIHTGFEAEYYPKYFDAFLRLIEPWPVEYLLLGQHFPGNEIGEKGSGWETTDPERIKRYSGQVCEALATGKFNCLAHPDIIWFTGADAVYEREMLRICEQAKKLDVPLEINMLGIRTGRSYPDERFWRIAGGVGNTVVCGSDAHTPCDVADRASFEKAQIWIDKYGLDFRPASVILEKGYRSK